ncbi:hypothetical protein BU17DRAFT_49335 [Hysterangium stoloniferum]|nr:hypothetical protein BU17DRAFT_49335 [Hysterangium stoloniferum]
MTSPFAKKPCTFYKANACTKGEKCPFSHVEQVISCNICKHFKVGTCMFGNRCRDIHTMPAEMKHCATPVRIACKFWQMGICNKGDQCNFLHEPLQRASTGESGSSSWRDNDSPIRSLPVCGNSVVTDTDEFPHEEDESSRQTLQHNIGHTVAIFGPGGQINELQTAFESRHVIISNVEPEIAFKEILAFVEKYGPLKSLVLKPSTHSGAPRKLEAEYTNVKVAAAALSAIDGESLGGKTLTAQFNSRSSQGDTADLRSSTLKLSWFAPSQIAYAHYNSISLARQKALALDGKEFGGRKILANFQDPSPKQRTSFTVVLKGLPFHFEKGTLIKFCGASSISTGPATFQGKKGTEHIRQLLETYGPLESFDDSHPKPNDVKVKALIRFVKAEHAYAAMKQINGQSYEFLGGGKIYVMLLHSLKYNIPRAQFGILEAQIRELRDPNDYSAQLRIYDTEEGQKGPQDRGVCLRLYGEDPKALARLKFGVEKLISGNCLVENDVPLWDNFFTTEASQTYIADMLKERGAFVRIDNRSRKIYVSGPSENRRAATQLLSQKIEELRRQRQLMQLTKPQLGILLRGKFTELQAHLGEEKLVLDVRSRTLTVQGDGEVVTMVKLAIDCDGQHLPENGPDGDCPVCFCELTNPVQLGCGHNYCLTCIKQYLTSSEKFPIRCLGENGGSSCDVPIPLATIKHVLEPSEEGKLLDTAYLAYVRQHPKEFHHCPTPDCQVIYRPAAEGTVLRCLSCLIRICAHCHVEDHEGMTCGQYRDHATGEESFKAWKAAHNVKSCPECGASIEKNEGCNHMTCVNCQTHMCWVCLKIFARDKLYEGDGVYAHMRNVHGDI